MRKEESYVDFTKSPSKPFLVPGMSRDIRQLSDDEPLEFFWDPRPSHLSNCRHVAPFVRYLHVSRIWFFFYEKPLFDVIAVNSYRWLLILFITVSLHASSETCNREDLFFLFLNLGVTEKIPDARNFSLGRSPANSNRNRLRERLPRKLQIANATARPGWINWVCESRGKALHNIVDGINWFHLWMRRKRR